MTSLRLSRSSFFFALLLLGLLAFTARPATDPDLWWHLRTGEWIVQNHSIPSTDPFSFTRNGTPWISHEWLAEILFYEIWRYAGWGGLIIFSAIITTTGFVVLFVRCEAPPHWAAGATALGALASAPAWGVRPQMFTFLIASAWLFLLVRGERRPRLLILVPPLFLLWLNLHAGFALGPALLVAFVIGLLWECFAGSTPWLEIRTYVFRLLALLGACMALVPLNPSGAELYRYPLDTMRSSIMRSFINEWHSPDFHREFYVPLLLLLLALTTAFALSSRLPRARILFPLLGTLLAALDAVRHIPIFVLLAVPVLASALPARASQWPTLLKNAGGDRRKTIAMGFALLTLAIFTATQWSKLIRDQAAHEAGSFPTSAVARLDAVQAPERLFAFYDWGGYAIWKLYPKYKVFVDGRADLYGAEPLQEFQKITQLRPGWQDPLTRWEIGTVLVPPTCALAQGLMLDPAWKQEYRDSGAALFVRKRDAQTTNTQPQVQSSSSLRPPLEGDKSEKMFTRARLNLRN